jgi:hypothetical protein
MCALIYSDDAGRCSVYVAVRLDWLPLVLQPEFVILRRGGAGCKAATA